MVSIQEASFQLLWLHHTYYSTPKCFIESIMFCISTYIRNTEADSALSTVLAAVNFVKTGRNYPLNNTFIILELFPPYKTNIELIESVETNYKFFNYLLRSDSSYFSFFPLKIATLMESQFNDQTNITELEFIYLMLFAVNIDREVDFDLLFGAALALYFVNHNINLDQKILNKYSINLSRNNEFYENFNRAFSTFSDFTKRNFVKLQKILFKGEIKIKNEIDIKAFKLHPEIDFEKLVKITENLNIRLKSLSKSKPVGCKPHKSKTKTKKFRNKPYKRKAVTITKDTLSRKQDTETHLKRSSLSSYPIRYPERKKPFTENVSEFSDSTKSSGSSTTSTESSFSSSISTSSTESSDGSCRKSLSEHTQPNTLPINRSPEHSKVQSKVERLLDSSDKSCNKSIDDELSKLTYKDVFGDISESFSDSSEEFSSPSPVKCNQSTDIKSKRNSCYNSKSCKSPKSKQIISNAYLEDLLRKLSVYEDGSPDPNELSDSDLIVGELSESEESCSSSPVKCNEVTDIKCERSDSFNSKSNKSPTNKKVIQSPERRSETKTARCSDNKCSDSNELSTGLINKTPTYVNIRKIAKPKVAIKEISNYFKKPAPTVNRKRKIKSQLDVHENLIKKFDSTKSQVIDETPSVATKKRKINLKISPVYIKSMDSKHPESRDKTQMSSAVYCEVDSKSEMNKLTNLRNRSQSVVENITTQSLDRNDDLKSKIKPSFACNKTNTRINTMEKFEYPTKISYIPYQPEYSLTDIPQHICQCKTPMKAHSSSGSDSSGWLVDGYSDTEEQKKVNFLRQNFKKVRLSHSSVKTKNDRKDPIYRSPSSNRRKRDFRNRDSTYSRKEGDYRTMDNRGRNDRDFKYDRKEHYSGSPNYKRSKVDCRVPDNRRETNFRGSD